MKIGSCKTPPKSTTSSSTESQHPEKYVATTSGKRAESSSDAYCGSCSGKSFITSGHWKATGRIVEQLTWKILYKNLDRKGGGVRGPGEVASPCTGQVMWKILYNNVDVRKRGGIGTGEGGLYVVDCMGFDGRAQLS